MERNGEGMNGWHVVPWNKELNLCTSFFFNSLRICKKKNVQTNRRELLFFPVQCLLISFTLIFGHIATGHTIYAQHPGQPDSKLTEMP